VRRGGLSWLWARRTGVICTSIQYKSFIHEVAALITRVGCKFERSYSPRVPPFKVERSESWCTYLYEDNLSQPWILCVASRSARGRLVDRQSELCRGNAVLFRPTVSMTTRLNIFRNKADNEGCRSVQKPVESHGDCRNGGSREIYWERGVNCQVTLASHQSALLVSCPRISVHRGNKLSPLQLWGSLGGRSGRNYGDCLSCGERARWKEWGGNNEESRSSG